ncbi:MAG: RidA family protein [Bauldia litoralis]
MSTETGYQVRANYPLVRRAGDFLYLSAVAAKQPDGTIAGATVDALGTMSLDIRAQTRATIENLRRSLQSAGADLGDLVEITGYLVSMADFGGYNEVYNAHFAAGDGPARTTVAVHQLPHPHYLVEMKGVAWKPEKG